MIVGSEIVAEILYNTSLKGAIVEYTLCEEASTNPNPSTIEDWENEQKSVVTSRMQDSRVYSYTYQYTDIKQSGSVILATQAEVDNFAGTGISKIEGSLIAGAADREEITNLDRLANLKQIDNSFVINPSYKGTDPTGLDNPEQLGGFKLGSITSASKNMMLKAVSLPSLLGVTGDFVVNSSVTEGMSILKVEFIGEDMYITSDALLGLDASAVESVGASLVVRDSVVQKRPVATEAIAFLALKQVGNEFTVQHFPKLQGAYLPALKSVVGTASSSDTSPIGSLTMTELHSVEGLTMKNCKEISIVELPGLISCRKTSVDTNGISKLNIASLKDVLGDMALANPLIEELDLSQMSFNGDTPTLQCKQLSKIAGSGAFNDSLFLLPKDCQLTEFMLGGISNIQDDFRCVSYFYVKKSAMPLIRVARDMTVALGSGSVNTTAEIELPKLQEIGGTLTLGTDKNVNNVIFPLSKKILGSCSATTCKLKNDIEFINLGSIGTDGADAQAKFKIEAANILCPKLGTANGEFDIVTSSFMFDMKVDKVSYPNVESISENLSITCPYSDFGSSSVLSIGFSGLRSAKGIGINRQGDVIDFGSFKYLFESNVLAGESQWSVEEYGYNPTFQEMKNREYKLAEQITKQ